MNAFKQAKPSPGVKKIHCLHPTDGDDLHCCLYSSQLSKHTKIDLSSDNSDCYSDDSVSEAEGNDAVSVDDDDYGSNDEDDDDYGSDDEVEGNVDDNDDSDSVDKNGDGDSDGIQTKLGLPNHTKECLNKECDEFELHPCGN